MIRGLVPIRDTRRIARRVSHIGPSLASILERIELVLAGHRDRDTAEEILGNAFTGRFPAVVHRRAERTHTLTHSHNAQNNNSTKSPV